MKIFSKLGKNINIIQSSETQSMKANAYGVYMDKSQNFVNCQYKMEAYANSIKGVPPLKIAAQHYHHI